MTIRYSEEKIKQLSDVHKLAENNLCLGFATWTLIGDKAMETLYAVTASGSIYTSTHPRRNQFNAAVQAWSPAEIVPFSAEFIGTYQLHQ